MENRLPEEIIQSIQSLLEAKEAARTSLLSKSWYTAWSKRPTLDFDRWLFGGGETYEKNLREFAKKTVQRYQKLKLNIESCRVVTFNLPLAKALIAEAMILGVVDLDIILWDDSFVFPNLVFRSETLARLSLTGYFMMDLVNLKFSNLKSLSLDQVRPNVYSFRDFISRFPFLERLVWKKRDWRENKLLELDMTESPETNSLKDIHKLVYLQMEGLYVEGNLLISSDFPFLKELEILDCRGLGNVRIRSESVERISIERDRVRVDANWYTELDIPNIKKFELDDGYGWSGLVFKTLCMGWESRLSVWCDAPTPEWLASLDGVLKQLRLSKLFPCINYWFELEERYVCGSGLLGAAGLPAPPVVENLTLEGRAVDPAFMDKLLLICRPKLIVRNCCLPKNSIHEYLLELVRKGILVEAVNAEVDQVPWRNSATARFHLRWRPEPSACA